MCCLPNRFPLPIFLLINKCDLIDEHIKNKLAEVCRISLLQQDHIINIYYTNLQDINSYINAFNWLNYKMHDINEKYKNN